MEIAHVILRVSKRYISFRRMSGSLGAMCYVVYSIGYWESNVKICSSTAVLLFVTLVPQLYSIRNFAMICPWSCSLANILHRLVDTLLSII